MMDMTHSTYLAVVILEFIQVFTCSGGSPEWTRLGCYYGNGNSGRALDGVRYNRYSDMTRRMCIDKCIEGNYRYSGVENAYACFCGNNDDYYRYGKSTNCWKECPGNEDMTCGGPNAIYIYKIKYSGCPVPVNIPHGNINGYNYDIGSWITFSCDRGYELQGASSSRCQYTGRWDKELPSCDKISCGRPDDPMHGSIRGSSFYYEDTVSTECDSGYELPHLGAIRRCGADGEWIPGHVYCIRKDCGNPGNMLHGTILGSSYKYEDEVEFVCNDGYRLETDTKVARCQANGVWSVLPPTCSRIKCPPLGQPDNGEMEGDLSFGTGANVIYSCHEGFQLEGELLLTCNQELDKGEWSTEPPTCQHIRCGAPVDLSHGSIRGATGDLTYGKQLSFLCDPGFALVGSTSATCRELGWDTEFPTCDAISCRNPEDPVNGAISNLRDDYRFEDMVEFVCDEGHTLEGSRTIICGDDGKWSSRPPTCQAVTCPPLGSLRQGTRFSDSFVFGSNVEFACYPGYALDGHNHTECLASGRWSHSPPVCQPCPLGTYKEDTSAGGCEACPESSTTSTVASSSINHCICDENMSKTQTGHCTAIVCDPLVPPEDGYIHDDCNIENGGTCRVGCNPGFVLQGDRTLKCTRRGWLGTPPICVECPMDTYKLSEESLTCMPCPVNTMTVGGPGNSEDDCVCQVGYERKPTGFCEDKDECEDDNGGCVQLCTNTMGSFKCECNIPGFSLDTDARNCTLKKTCPDMNQEVKDGNLSCTFWSKNNANICHIKCNRGFFFVSGTNNYITCGFDTNYQWSHRLVNVTARIPACTREFFVDSQLPVGFTFTSDVMCNAAELYSQAIVDRASQLVLNSNQCITGNCAIKYANVNCVDNPEGGSRIALSFEVLLKNPELGAVSLECDSSCQRKNLRQMLGATFKIKLAVEEIVRNGSVNLEGETNAPRVNPNSFKFKSPKIICETPGRALTKSRLCVPCDSGYFLQTPGDELCKPCPRGTFQTEQGQTSCIPCYPGSTTTDVGSNHPVMCSIKV